MLTFALQFYRVAISKMATCKESLLVDGCLLCPHCGQYLKLRTCREHKELYYDASSHVWVTTKRPKTSSVTDSNGSNVLTIPETEVSSMSTVLL